MAHNLKYLLAVTIVGLSLSTSSCGKGHSVSDQFAAAEIANADEDMNATRDICNGIMTSAEKRGIEASDYARLSILYMQLNDRTDNPDDIQLAARCYREAFKLNADSAQNFYRTLPVEQEKYAMTLSTIVHALDNPREIPSDHDWEVPATEIGKVTDPAVVDSINQTADISTETTYPMTASPAPWPAKALNIIFLNASEFGLERSVIPENRIRRDRPGRVY